MLIDNEKLVGLLMENSGLEQEKVEKQLAELVSDIKKALEENEAYEVEGFGIFSKLGNNIHFIPSEDLETEINYKYVGMEPIELPGSGDSSSEDSSDIEDTNQRPRQVGGIVAGRSELAEEGQRRPSKAVRSPGCGAQRSAGTHRQVALPVGQSHANAYC